MLGGKVEKSNHEQSKLDDSIEAIKSNVIKSGKSVASASKKAAESASKLASELTERISTKKDEMVENRKRKREEFVSSLKDDEKYKQIIVDDEKLPPMIYLPTEEHQNLLNKIDDLEMEVSRLQSVVEKAGVEILSDLPKIEHGNDDEKKEKKDAGSGLTLEVNKSLNQILITMGVSVVWAIILIVINFELEKRDIVFSGLGAKAVVWPLGTAIWTLFLLNSQSKVGTLLSMEFSNRVKTSLGVGLATTLSLMLTDGEMKAITNVWGWAMTIALCAFLLSGFFRGLFSSLRKISNKLRL